LIRLKIEGLKMILINLTGDFEIDGKTSANIDDIPELLQLEAFLSALRGTVDSNSGPFLSGISEIVNGVKRTNLNNVALKITSELCDGKLVHHFQIVEC
jgi:hypothetical protein